MNRDTINICKIHLKLEKNVIYITILLNRKRTKDLKDKNDEKDEKDLKDDRIKHAESL